MPSESYKLELPAGSYRAFVWTESGLISPAVSFKVPAKAPIKLMRLSTPRFQFLTTNFQTGRAAGDVSVRLQRQGVTQPVDFTTGVNGDAYVNVAAGQYTARIMTEGLSHSASLIELRMPTIGPNGDPETAFGHEIWASKPLSFRLQLIGPRTMEPWSEYSISLPPQDGRIKFNDRGQAQVTAELPNDPLALKLWMKDSFTSFIYLDGGLPLEGETITLDFSDGSPLTVNLEISEEAAETISSTDCTLSINYADKQGNSFSVGPRIQSSGKVHFDAVPSGMATISLNLSLDGARMEAVAVTQIEIKSSESNSCTLRVPHIPRRVQFLGPNSAPLAGAYIEVSDANFRTPWVVGGEVDERGCFRIPIPDGHQLACRAFHVGKNATRQLAIDVPVTAQEVDDGVVDLNPFDIIEPTLKFHFAAPITAHAEILGEVNPLVFERIPSNNEGRFGAIAISSRSQARIRVAAGDLWVEDPVRKIDFNDLDFHIYPRGIVVTAFIDELAVFRHEALGTAIADWMNSDLVRLNETVAGVTSLSIPTGLYLGPDGSSLVVPADGSITWTP